MRKPEPVPHLVAVDARIVAPDRHPGRAPALGDTVARQRRRAAAQRCVLIAERVVEQQVHADVVREVHRRVPHVRAVVSRARQVELGLAVAVDVADVVRLWLRQRHPLARDRAPRQVDVVVRHLAPVVVERRTDPWLRETADSRGGVRHGRHVGKAAEERHPRLTAGEQRAAGQLRRHWTGRPQPSTTMSVCAD